jgi:hypothetical protein
LALSTDRLQLEGEEYIAWPPSNVVRSDYSINVNPLIAAGIEK